MRKRLVIVALMVMVSVFLFYEGAFAAKEGPTGWSGWAWGTRYGTVSGELRYTETWLGHNLYNRPADPGKTQLYIFQTQNYAFLDGSLEGIFFVADMSTMALAKTVILNVFGEPDNVADLGQAKISLWLGTVGHILVSENFVDGDLIMNVGTPEFISRIIAALLAVVQQ